MASTVESVIDELTEKVGSNPSVNSVLKSIDDRLKVVSDTFQKPQDSKLIEAFKAIGKSNTDILSEKLNKVSEPPTTQQDSTKTEEVDERNEPTKHLDALVDKFSSFFSSKKEEQPEAQKSTEPKTEEVDERNEPTKHLDALVDKFSGLFSSKKSENQSVGIVASAEKARSEVKSTTQDTQKTKTDTSDSNSPLLSKIANILLTIQNSFTKVKESTVSKFSTQDKVNTVAQRGSNSPEIQRSTANISSTQTARAGGDEGSRATPRRPLPDRARIFAWAAGMPHAARSLRRARGRRRLLEAALCRPRAQARPVPRMGCRGHRPRGSQPAARARRCRSVEPPAARKFAARAQRAATAARAVRPPRLRRQRLRLGVGRRYLGAAAARAHDAAT